jgi:hypothetical protein
MAKFGPTRSDLRFRLVLSAAGLALLAGALAYRGLPVSAGGWEAVLIAGAFFGGTFAWTLRRLARKEYAESD